MNERSYRSYRGTIFFKRFNPAEESLYRTALFIEFRIKPEWSSSFRLFPGSLVDRNVALGSPFPVVLADFPGIVGRICGDDPGTIQYLGNLKRFEGWLVKPGIMDIFRGNCAGKGKTVPIDQNIKFIPVYLYYSHHIRSILFFCRDILGIRRTVEDIDFFDLVPGSKQVEENRLVHSFLAEFEVVPVNR